MCVDHYLVVMEAIVKTCGTNISVSVNLATVARTVHCTVAPWLTCALTTPPAWISEKIMNVSAYEIINYIHEVKFSYEHVVMKCPIVNVTFYNSCLFNQLSTISRVGRLYAHFKLDRLFLTSPSRSMYV